VGNGGGNAVRSGEGKAMGSEVCKAVGNEGGKAVEVEKVKRWNAKVKRWEVRKVIRRKMDDNLKVTFM
jgi:hypothetical protein